MNPLNDNLVIPLILHCTMVYPKNMIIGICLAEFPDIGNYHVRVFYYCLYNDRSKDGVQ